MPAPTTTTAPTTAAGAAPSLLSWSRWAPYFNLPVTGSFASEAQKAAYIVDNMGASVEKNVLRELLKQADGAAFLTVRACGGVCVDGWADAPKSTDRFISSDSPPTKKKTKKQIRWRRPACS